jgi:membrane protein DedA with SNARE-associated domain
MMVHIFREYGYGLLFAVILGETLGLPIPSYPLVLLAVALAADLHLSLGGILIVAVLAALMGDMTWYLVGRRPNGKLLRAAWSEIPVGHQVLSRFEHRGSTDCGYVGNLPPAVHSL